MIVQTGSFKWLSTVMGSRKAVGYVDATSWANSLLQLRCFAGFIGIVFFNAFNDWLVCPLEYKTFLGREFHVMIFQIWKNRKGKTQKRILVKTSVSEKEWITGTCGKWSFTKHHIFGICTSKKKVRDSWKYRVFIIFSGWFCMKCPTFDPWLETSTWCSD